MSTVETANRVEAFHRMAEQMVRGYFGRATIGGIDYAAYLAWDLDADSDYRSDIRTGHESQTGRVAAFTRGDWHHNTVNLSIMDDDDNETQRVSVGAVESDASAEYLAGIVASLYAEITIDSEETTA